MYAITGATGHTGSVAAEKLLAKGQKVRVIGRDRRKLERLVQKGAEAAVADMANGEALTNAFAGARAAYVLIPPNIAATDVRDYQERVSDALAAAIEKSGIKHAVVLSSIGADQPEKTGPVVGLHNLEKKLERIPGLSALFLRAGYFMENLLPQVGVIGALGMMAGPIKRDLPLPFIATKDIGAAAAEALLKLDFQGKRTQELQGERDVTYAEVAKIVGAAIGKPGLAYLEAPKAQLKSALTRMGMSASMADLLLEMADGLNSGLMRTLEPRSAANTTPTKIEDFVTEVLVPAYRAKTAGA